jgi:hypothetical protein
MLLDMSSTDKIVFMFFISQLISEFFAQRAVWVGGGGDIVNSLRPAGRGGGGDKVSRSLPFQGPKKSQGPPLPMALEMEGTLIVKACLSARVRQQGR